MFQLPKDEQHKPKAQPRNFFIYGAPMSGKSYFSSFFPHPLSLNTDGNSEQGTASSVQLRNIRSQNGGLQQSVIKQLDDIIIALQTQNHSYKTVVVDVVDDLVVMIEQAICLENKVQALSDIPYGKGYAMFNAVLQQFVMDLKSLPMNVIYISREIEITDENTGAIHYEQSLKTKYYNVITGNCDLVIRTRKIGDGQNASYFREVKALRTKYDPENITNKRVLQLLKSCDGMFTKEQLEKMSKEQGENK